MRQHLPRRGFRRPLILFAASMAFIYAILLTALSQAWNDEARTSVYYALAAVTIITILGGAAIALMSVFAERSIAHLEALEKLADEALAARRRRSR